MAAVSSTGRGAHLIQLAEIIDAVGDRIDVICDGGIARGTHVLKALSLGAKACSGGRLYLYALAAAGQAGVERALGNLRAEIERDMKLSNRSRAWNPTGQVDPGTSNSPAGNAGGE